MEQVRVRLPPERILAVGVLAVALVAACGSSSPTPSPPASAPEATPATPAAGAWTEASLPQPSAVTTAPSLAPGYHCSPCHAPAASQLEGIARTPDGLVAVGLQQPPALAIAYASDPGGEWRRLPGFAPAAGSTAVAVAAGPRMTVIVGSNGTSPATWSSSGDGWAAAQPEVPRTTTSSSAMTSVVAVPLGSAGFVAGGFHDDPARGLASGAIWRSTDGVHWRLDEAPGVFEGGRVLGVAAAGNTVVAVGTVGSPTYGPAAAWVSSGGGPWRKASIAPDGGGAMRAVAATQAGFVAVGQNERDDGAAAWTSPDGGAWTRVPDQSSLGSSGTPVRMLSIAADGSGLVAGGWRSDAGNGSAMAWTSADGRRWDATAWVPAFSGGQMAGIAVDGGQTIGVGRTGYPDNDQATIWTAPR